MKTSPDLLIFLHYGHTFFPSACISKIPNKIFSLLAKIPCEDMCVISKKSYFAINVSSRAFECGHVCQCPHHIPPYLKGVVLPDVEEQSVLSVRAVATL